MTATSRTVRMSLSLSSFRPLTPETKLGFCWLGVENFKLNVEIKSEQLLQTRVPGYL